jgi:hypothetical protein
MIIKTWYKPTAPCRRPAIQSYKNVSRETFWYWAKNLTMPHTSSGLKRVRSRGKARRCRDGPGVQHGSCSAAKLQPVLHRIFARRNHRVFHRLTLEQNGLALATSAYPSRRCIAGFRPRLTLALKVPRTVMIIFPCLFQRFVLAPLKRRKSLFRVIRQFYIFVFLFHVFCSQSEFYSAPTILPRWSQKVRRSSTRLPLLRLFDLPHSLKHNARSCLEVLFSVTGAALTRATE